jgi:hypothetical protein
MSKHTPFPCDLEAECAVLGSLLIDPEALERIVTTLQADDFYRDAHQVIDEQTFCTLTVLLVRMSGARLASRMRAASNRGYKLEWNIPESCPYRP